MDKRRTAQDPYDLCIVKHRDREGVQDQCANVEYGPRGVCPEKDRSTSGCESRPGKPPEEPGRQPPASGEILASKRGEAKLQAATRVNSTASQAHPVRGRAGRA